MADETSETSATASSGGNWWSSGAGAGPNGLSQWSCNIHNMLLPAAVVTQPCSTSALTNIQWSSDIPNSSGSRAGDQDVDNLSNSSNLSHQDLVDSGTALLDSSVQMDHFGGVSDNNAAVWTQVLLGTSGSGEAVQNTSVGNLHEVLYTRAPRQELLEPSDHLQKTQEAEVPSGWEFRPSFPSFQAEDHMSLGKPAQIAAPLLYNPQLLDERLHGGNATLSDLGSWSVAPPDQASGGLMSRNICLNTFSNSELGLPVQRFDLGRIKQECPNMTNYSNALGISPNALLQGFGSEPNYKNVQEGFSHILESANKPFLKSLSAHAATGACCSHINAGDHHHHHEYNPHGGRWPISPNMSTSTQLPVALSQLLLSSPSKQATNVLNFGANKQHFDGKQMHNIPAQHRTTGDEARDSCTDTKRCGADQSSAGDTIFKRPRLEATTTVPPFKVRKEKLGDRITALQQLVSPFGKTDTASVLLEAIGYIKFLQEQVQVLSTPYMKSGGTSAQGAQDQKGWGASDNKDPEEPKQDLRSRGLCLVPVSCTLHVANDNGADFWTPSLGSGSYR